MTGFGGPDGATSTIQLRFGPGDRLYVSSLSPEYAPDIESCAQAERMATSDLTSCQQIPGGVLEVFGSSRGEGDSVLAYRIDGAGQVAAWVEPSNGDDAALDLVTAIVSDPRLGYRVDASTFNGAADLTNYEDIEVTTEIR